MDKYDRKLCVIGNQSKSIRKFYAMAELPFKSVGVCLWDRLDCSLKYSNQLQIEKQK